LVADCHEIGDLVWQLRFDFGFPVGEHFCSFNEETPQQTTQIKTNNEGSLFHWTHSLPTSDYYYFRIYALFLFRDEEF